MYERRPVGTAVEQQEFIVDEKRVNRADSLVRPEHEHVLGEEEEAGAKCSQVHDRQTEETEVDAVPQTLLEENDDVNELARSSDEKKEWYDDGGFNFGYKELGFWRDEVAVSIR